MNEGMPIYTFENPSPSHDTDRVERKLEPVGVEPGEKFDKNEALKEAQETLIGNEKLYKKFLRGLAARENKDATDLASIENTFIRYCQNLPDAEIESLIRQFNTGIRKYIVDNQGVLEISQKTIQEMLSRNHRGISSPGILSVINFIKARKKLLSAKPSQEYVFYSEDVLDARYKIDLIECIYTENGDIDTMNLIQIKSSVPDTKNTGNHRQSP